MVRRRPDLVKHTNEEVEMVAAALTIGLAAFAVVFLFSRSKKDVSK